MRRVRKEKSVQALSASRTLDIDVVCTPFLRWAGGKRLLIRRLLPHLPSRREWNTYWEPFLGAGTMFFTLQPQSAVISDFNSALVDCYKHVAQRPELISRYLRHHARRTCEDYFYDIRKRYNNGGTSAAQAARFIYLNATCFNGIYRVNSRGEFNVPYGRKEPPKLPSADHLVHASTILKKATIQDGSFELVLARASKGDFIYLDPPYPPVSVTANFDKYTQQRFGFGRQKELSEVAHDLDRRGCLVMITNADLPQIREMYSEWHHSQLSVVRWVSAKSRKLRVRELVITNYRTSVNDE